jgi:hypothetical protein
MGGCEHEWKKNLPVYKIEKGGLASIDSEPCTQAIDSRYGNEEGYLSPFFFFNRAFVKYYANFVRFSISLHHQVVYTNKKKPTIT